MVQLRDDVTPDRRAGRRSPGAGRAAGTDRRAADRQQPPRGRGGRRGCRGSCRPGRRVARPGASPARGHEPSSGLSITAPEQVAGRAIRRASTIWASGRFSPPRPRPTRRRRWGWPALPRSGRARRCPSSRSAGSTVTNAAAAIAAGADGIAVVSAHVRRGGARGGGARAGRARRGRHGTREPGGDGRRMAGRAVHRRGARPAARLALPAASAGTSGPMASRSRPRPEPISGRARITASGSTTATRCWPRSSGDFVLETRVRVQPGPPVRPGRADGAADARRAGSRPRWSSSPASRAGWAR